MTIYKTLTPADITSDMLYGFAHEQHITKKYVKTENGFVITDADDRR